MGNYLQKRSYNKKMKPFSGSNSPLLNNARKRLKVISTIFAALYLILSFRVVDITIFGTNNDKIPYNKINIASKDTIFHRANIVDRNGTLLAINLATASLYANPQVILDVKEAVDKLSIAFPKINRNTLKRRLSSDKKFVWIKRNLTPKEQNSINKLGIPGLYFTREEKRVYPHKNLLSHVLGYVNIDGYGISGIEKYSDEYLRKGWAEKELPLQLSIDVRVQQILHNSLVKAMKSYQSKGVSGIVMDSRNGEIIAISSLPDFDPNSAGTAEKSSLFNKATLGVYEMGSTFKTFNMAFGLESGKISMNDMYDVSEPLKISNFTIEDFHKGKPILSFPEVYIHSSNIGSARIALKAGEDNQKNFIEKLGLLSDLELEVVERGSPLYPNNWGKAHTMTISYGHGIAVTPVHVAQATSALINGGKFYPGTLIKDKNNNINAENVVSKKTSDNIRKLMRFAVEYGTGGRADAKGYLVGGKTGSADKASKGGYYNSSIIASFIGAFPMNDPKYVVFVMVDEPKDNFETYGIATGGTVAAPLVKNIISHIGPILGIHPVNENDYEIRKEFWYDYDKKNAKMASIGTY